LAGAGSCSVTFGALEELADDDAKVVVTTFRSGVLDGIAPAAYARNGHVIAFMVVAIPAI